MKQIKWFFLFIFVFLLVLSCENKKMSQDAVCSKEVKALQYYARLDDSVIEKPDSKINLFHYWRDIESGNYLFGNPTDEQIEEWKDLCARNNLLEAVTSLSQLMGYKDMNQFVTVHDMYSLWYFDGEHHNNNLTLWRLEQYDTVAHSPSSGQERFEILKSRIESLCDFEPQFQVSMNFRAGFEEDLKAFYNRVLLIELIGNTDDKIGQALRKENDAWLCYHSAVDSSFRIIDGNPDGMVGSAWSMSISGILSDNDDIRSCSLEDLYCSLVDNSDISTLEHHVFISEKKVLTEYLRFMNSFKEDEAYYPVPERKEALFLEMKAWKEWMVARKAVSSLLSGKCKEAYDNATNNVRRMKYIMLKNRYSGYGVTSNDVYELLIPYTVSDEELDGPSFDEKWNHLLGN